MMVTVVVVSGMMEIAVNNKIIGRLMDFKNNSSGTSRSFVVFNSIKTPLINVDAYNITVNGFKNVLLFMIVSRIKRCMVSKKSKFNNVIMLMEK